MEQPNLSYIDSLSAGDDAFKTELIRVIKFEFPLEKETYFENIKAENYKKTAENVHKLKHKISILGLVKSYEVAVAFENNLKENSCLLKTEFEAVLNTITNFLPTL